MTNRSQCNNTARRKERVRAAACAAPAACRASSTAAGDAQPIELDHNALYHKLRQEAFHASDPDAEARRHEGTGAAARCPDASVPQQVLHIDFQRVDAKKKIHMKVPLHFINADIAPGVKTGGGIVSHVMNELDITCLPDDLPEFIEVDLAHLAARPFDPRVRPEVAQGRGSRCMHACARTPWWRPCRCRVRMIEAEEAAAAEAAAAAAASCRAGSGAASSRCGDSRGKRRRRSRLTRRPKKEAGRSTGRHKPGHADSSMRRAFLFSAICRLHMTA